jgi:O-6-methylguanine DNA methyltransferase
MLPFRKRMRDMRLKLEKIETPIGAILIAHDDKQICNLEFADCEDRMQRLLARHFPGVAIERTKQRSKFAVALRHYFKGDVSAIDDLPVAKLGTPFQQRAWAALRRIPAGETRSYGEQARAIRAPNAARAVGLANHLNPIGIVVPCHRVRGADGALTGYAGGLERKRWLLDHEVRHAS